MRRLDIGIASYGRNWQQLERTLAALVKHSVTDFRCFIVHNPSAGDEQTKEAICRIADRDKRFIPVWKSENVGYAGACNAILATAETEYIAYLDNDAEVLTPGWDETLCSYLDRFHEIGLIFPNDGAYQIDRGPYKEVLWACGFCWIMNRMCASDLSLKSDVSYLLSSLLFGKDPGYIFDQNLGHQEEADVCQRVRMAGWRCAAVPEVRCDHKATATNDAASTERINRGVVNWVNKHNRYFNGKNFNYHSANVTRFEDWPPNALYLEEYWKQRMPELNANPEVVKIDGREYDLIKVPRFSGFYRNRII